MGLFGFLKKKPKISEGDRYYHLGLDVPEHRREYFEKGVALGNCHCQYGLAKYLLENEEPTPELLNRVVTLYTEAEAGGSLFDHHYLGYAYSKLGQHEKAVECYRSSAEGGNVSAQFNLGCAYHFGNGVEVDPKQAMMWYGKAMEQGHATATNNLGVMHHDGVGVPKNHKKAFDLYQLAADRGSVYAIGNLARAYYNGEGVQKNDRAALEWAQKGIKEDNLSSEYIMALLNWEGKVVSQDRVKAVQHMRWLVNKDYDDAIEKLPELEKELAALAEQYYEEGLAKKDLSLLDKAREYGKEEAGQAISNLADELCREGLAELNADKLRTAANRGKIDARFMLAFDAAADGNVLHDKNLLKQDEEMRRRMSDFEWYREHKDTEKCRTDSGIDASAIEEALLAKMVSIGVRLLRNGHSFDAMCWLEPLESYGKSVILYDLALANIGEGNYDVGRKYLNKALKCRDITSDVSNAANRMLKQIQYLNDDDPPPSAGTSYICPSDSEDRYKDDPQFSLYSIPGIVFDDSNQRWMRRGVYGDHAVYYNDQGSEVTIYSAQVSGSSASTSAGNLHWY